MIKREFYDEGKLILKPGQLSTHAWLIEKGSAMGFIFKDGRKVPSWFWNENEFIIPFDSFFNQVPSNSYIEITEPTILLSISFDRVNEIMKTFPDSNDYIWRIMRDFQRMNFKKD